MSYRGRPSKGCKRCVAKKIKCDRTQPLCQRCVGANAPCEYPDFFELVHRNQTQSAERTAKAKWRQRASKTTIDGLHDATPSKQPSPPSLSSRSSSSPRTALVTAVTTPIPSQLSVRPSLENLAYARFVYDFVGTQDAPVNEQGGLETLPQLFDASSPGSPLHCVVSAVALANFGSRTKSTEATVRGAVYYGKALNTLAVAMAGPKERIRTSEAMLGIFLLGIYETLTSSTFDGTYLMHQYGAMSLLRDRWDDGTLQHGYKNRYLSVIYLHLLMDSLSQSTRPPLFDPKWELFPRGSPREELPKLMHLAATARHRLATDIPNASPAQHGASPSPDLSGSADALDDALDIDARLQEWHQKNVITLSWIEGPAVPIQPEGRPPWARALFGLPGAPGEMHTYQDVRCTLAANFYRGGRIWLNLSVLRRAARRAADPATSSAQRSYFEALVSATASLLMQLVDDICLSVPSLLHLGSDGGGSDPAAPDDICSSRGMLVFWPLISCTVALTQEPVRILDVRLRRAWILCVLAFLRNSIGVAKAEAFQAFAMLPQQVPLATLDIPYQEAKYPVLLQ